MRILLFIALLFMGQLHLFAQMVSNNNDDDVNKIDTRMSRTACREGEILVKFKPKSAVSVKRRANGKFSTSSVSSVDAVLKDIGVEEMEQLMPNMGNAQPAKARMRIRDRKMQQAATENLSKLYRMKLSSKDHDLYDPIEKLKALDEVEFAEPNYLVFTTATADDYQNEPLYPVQWGLNAVNLPQLWAVPTTPENRPVIAILDTGVDISHPDLEANIWTNAREANGEEGYDNDNNGFKNDVHGWDFINQTGNIADYNGHGTHCAGIAGAVGDNGVGVVGANPDALIMPVTVMQSDGVGDVATIIRGIDYAAANGADVISMSFGTYAGSTALEQALGRAYQSAVLVAAAGNDGNCLSHRHDIRGQSSPMPLFPASYQFVLGVQATNTNGDLAGFSNYDDDGPVYSIYSEEKLFNYELKAPGINIMSTYPNGNYKSFNGTSMACPLVAGAISRLIQVKDYDSKEVLFGDLIHSNMPSGNLDIYHAFSFTDEERKPSLKIVTYTLDDSEGDNDGRPDAGETVLIFPTIRNEWGTAANIKASIELGETADASLIEFIDDKVDLPTLNSYGKAKAATPFKIKIKDNCVDGRHIILRINATCDNITEDCHQNLVLTVENGVELGGIISEDRTLYPHIHYIVTSNLGLGQGVTMTIKPGTIIKFKDGVGFNAKSGILNAVGKPDSLIVFTTADGSQGKITEIASYQTIDYAVFDGFYGSTGGIIKTNCKNCIIQNFTGGTILLGPNVYEKCNIYDNIANMSDFNSSAHYISCNSSGNHLKASGLINFNQALWGDNVRSRNCNFIGNTNNYRYNNNYIVTVSSSEANLYTPEMPCYFGTSKESTAQQFIFDIKCPEYTGYGQYDLSNMLTRPAAEAHGIVWKVVVNGYDAQDEFDELPPLGVGRHKFEVYFNRPMNKEVAPMIAMGVREPYMQTTIGEDGEWNEEGTVYTAYLTISGKYVGDGLNRIYVTNAQDDEYFEIPVEKYRFNVLVQCAGSMSAGFEAVPGLGRVSLEWEAPTEEFDDLLGYNIYRYTLNESGEPADAVKLNSQLLESNETSYVDYDVTPNQTYYYYYKVMTTDLAENDPSKVVAASPLTSALGDANGSGEVDVADVITTVNYAAGLDPKPFIFEAADMNTDSQINVIDVVGIIYKILNPEGETKMRTEATATFTVEDGVLYVESPVALAGVQVLVNSQEQEIPSVLEALNGFEQASAWMTDEDCVLLAYNMAGKTLPAGKTAIMQIGGSALRDIRLSDAYGNNVTALPGNATSIIDMSLPTKLNAAGIYNLNGQKVAGSAGQLNRLPKGFYIVGGQKIVK